MFYRRRPASTAGWVPAFAGTTTFPHCLTGGFWLGVLVDRVDPAHFLRPFDGLDVEIDDDRIVVAAHQHAFERLVGRGVDLLVRHIGRDIDEVARARLGDKFEMLAPTHPRP